jgi:protein unc-80
MQNQIQRLNQIPLLALCKCVLIMSDELFLDLVKITWNLLLNSDQEIASAAGKLKYIKIKYLL